MPRKYTHINDFEEIIVEKINEGQSLRTIGDTLGFTYKEMRGFKTRYNKKQRQIEAGKAIHKKGRPCKTDGELPPSIQRLDKLAQMRYTLASKERYIKQLEMENELMRDFLSLTERK
jgi:hypothetical protein